MNRYFVSILVLFSLALAIYLPSLLEKTKAPAVTKERDNLVPEYVAHNLRSILFDKDGLPSHSMQAQKMEFFQLADYTFTEFERPTYKIVSPEEQSPWQLTAAEGTLENKDKVILEYDVQILSLGEDGVVRKISTDYVEIDLNSQVMSTDRPVVMESDYFTSYGEGMVIKLLDRNIKIKKHAKTIYRNVQI